MTSHGSTTHDEISSLYSASIFSYPNIGDSEQGFAVQAVPTWYITPLVTDEIYTSEKKSTPFFMNCKQVDCHPDKILYTGQYIYVIHV